MMIEIEPLNPYLCETCIYPNTQTETLKKHQETNREVQCYTCNFCKDAVNRKNDLAGHLRNHHEDHVEIEQLNVEALSNPHANVRTNKLVCKGKDESGAKVDTAESRVKVDIEVTPVLEKESHLILIQKNVFLI